MAYNNFNPDIHKELLGHAWWEADNYAPITAQVDCTFEEYETDVELFTGSYVSGDRTGSIDAEFASFIFIQPFTGTNEELGNSGDIDCTFQSYASDIEIFTGTVVEANLSGDITCTGQEFNLQMQSGLHVDLSMQPWEFVSSFTIEGDDVDNCEFRELTFEAYARVDYVTLVLDGRKWTCEMGDAPEVDLTFEQFTLTGEVYPGYTGGINAVGRRFEASMIGGAPSNIDCELEELTFSATGDVPIESSLELTVRVLQAEMDGTTPWASHMDLRGMQWRLDAAAGISGDRLGGLSLNFRQLEISGNVDGGKVADIDSIFRSLLFKATAGTDGVDDLDLETLPPEIEMGSGGAMSGETCAVADDLTFEEVL